MVFKTALLMMENIITLNVKDLPYKKMKGFLKNHKINPDNIALKVEFSEEFTRFTPLEYWQSYLPFSHKVVTIVLLKMNNFFLFVGHSTNHETVIYNPEFSKLLLNINSKRVVKPLDNRWQKGKRRHNTKSEIIYLNMLLDKINTLGFNSLSREEREDLDTLSKNNN